jgi:hypothetical protein
VEIEPRHPPLGGFDRLLLAAAFAAGCVIATRAASIGDYPLDAGPALSAIAHGHLGAFFAHQPAMGAVSLYLRAPFAALAVALRCTDLGVYRWGVLPCVLSVGVVACWCARIAARHGMSRPGQAVLVTTALFNPLLFNALHYGHPEELLTAALAVGALLAACEQHPVRSAVLAGLAAASKQWALLIVLPALLVLERDRIRAAAVMLVTGATATLPLLLANPGSFAHALGYIAHPQAPTTMFNWLYPFSPAGTGHVAMIFGPSRPYFGRVDPGVELAVSHPLIVCIGLVLPVLVFCARGRRLGASSALLVTALALLLRGTLDPGAWPYYSAPVVFVLLAADAYSGRALPLAGLSAWAGAFVFLDRFPAYLPVGEANAIYIVASVAAVALLVRALRRGVPARAGYSPSSPSIA